MDPVRYYITVIATNGYNLLTPQITNDEMINGMSRIDIQVSSEPRPRFRKIDDQIWFPIQCLIGELRFKDMDLFKISNEEEVLVV